MRLLLWEQIRDDKPHYPDVIQAIELILPKNSKIVGKTLREAKLHKECLICAVVHNDEVFVPNGDTIFYPEDRIIIFVKAGYVKNVMPAFEGKE